METPCGSTQNCCSGIDARMKIRTIIPILLVASMTCSASELRQLPLPRMGPGDDYTYAVCPSAMVDDDGSVWLAATVGRLVNGEWAASYEQLRVYHFTDAGVRAWVVADNREDGEDGLFEVCQTSIAKINHTLVVAATATIIPYGSDVTRRFYSVSAWGYSGGRWARWSPLITHEFVDSPDCQWKSLWLGDPVLLPMHESAAVYWAEQACDGTWEEWVGLHRLPGEPVQVDVGVQLDQAGAFIADAAWASPDHSRLYAIVIPHSDQAPPWPLYDTESWTEQGGGHNFAWNLGPSNGWARNPALFRNSRGLLLGPHTVIFESTDDLTEPFTPPVGEPVVFKVWLWGDPLLRLPNTMIDPPPYTGINSARNVEIGGRPIGR